MSYSPTSNLVFGIFIDKCDLEIVTKVRGCNHSCDLNAKFCSTCGKPVYKEEKTMIAEGGSFYDLDTVGFFTSSCYSTDGILGIPLRKTEDQDTGYYVVPKPTEQDIAIVKKFLLEHDFDFEDDDLETFFYTYHG